MLTDTQIRNLKPAEKAKKYADGGGLYLYVAKTGSKLWRMAYRFNDKEKLLSFGEYPIVSLKDARTKRNEAKKLLADGELHAQRTAAAEQDLVSVLRGRRQRRGQAECAVEIPRTHAVPHGDAAQPPGESAGSGGVEQCFQQEDGLQTGAYAQNEQNGLHSANMVS